MNIRLICHWQSPTQVHAQLANSYSFTAVLATQQVHCLSPFTAWQRISSSLLPVEYPPIASLIIKNFYNNENTM